MVATANYNMTFDNGRFVKGEVYKYRVDNDLEKIFITTEEHKEQELSYTEFDILFTVF